MAATAMALSFAVTLCTKAQDTKPWSEKETRLATEYLNLLVEKPEPGRVLDLLWELYDKRGQTGFLLESIAAQAKQQAHPHTLLIHAHLLRKAGRTAEAKARYEEVLKLGASEGIAERALADLATESGEPAAALAHLRSLSERLPEGDPQQAPLLMQIGRAALAAEKPEEAAAAWERAAALQPQNTALNSEVAQLLLGSGHADKALGLYRRLAENADPARRLDALHDLSRLEEQADHFEASAKCLRDGLALLHFKDWRYGQFFQRLVKLHERFGRLDDLKTALAKAAEVKPPQEQALADMARFAALTVDADAQVKWLRALTQHFPAAQDYRWELVRVLLDQEGAAEAAKLLDEVLKNDGSDLAALVLLRGEAHLRLGETEAAAQRLMKLLEVQGGVVDVSKQVLAFAQERSLDSIVEQSLRSRIAREPEKAEAVFELASFLMKRKKVAEARRLCDEWLAAAERRSGAVQEVRQRLRQVAAFFSAGQEAGLAEEYAQRAASATWQGGKEELVDYADILSQRGEITEPVQLLERAWAASATPEDRLDVDERLLALLSGGQAPAPPATAPEPGSEFKLPAIFSGEGFGSEAPRPGRSEVPGAVRDYALGQALQVSCYKFQLSGLGLRVWPFSLLPSPFPMAAPSPERVLRAAWWCFRAEEWQLAYQMLAALHFNGQGRWIEAPVEVEKLLLDLALADGNTLLAIRQLHVLQRLDPASRTGHLLRLAEQEARWEREALAAVPVEGGPKWLLAQRGSGGPADRGFAGAVKILESLVREEPQNESVLSALAQFYIETGRRDEALALWQKAANGAKGAAAPLLERYAELLLAQRRHREFIGIQMRLLTDEGDVKRRREGFNRMLERLLWADVTQSNSLPEEELKRRLDLMLAALQERARRAPFEGFWHEALAAVHDKQGDATKAFAEMKQAYYLAPDTPYSLDQLRAAALKVGDQKSAVYFQKQIAAGAAPKDEAAEWRQLVTLLEQDFRMAEADQVRRRMEARFAQDPAALEELGRHYAETGQEEAARRVQQQLARVRGWDLKNLLSLALQQQQDGDWVAAEKTLLQILATPPPASAAAPVAPERLSWPLFDERRTQPAAPSFLLTALENAPGLTAPVRERLRILLSVPRGEFALVPEEPAHVRLRAVEELAKMGRAPAPATQLHGMEPVWAACYAGRGEELRGMLQARLGGVTSPEAQFILVWLTVKSRGLREALAWAQDDTVPAARLEARKGMLQAVANLLADDATFEFVPAELEVLGGAGLFSNAEITDIARKLEGRQRQEASCTLRLAALRRSPEPELMELAVIAQLHESLGRPGEQAQLLRRIWDMPLKAGAAHPGDGFLYSLSQLLRLAPDAAARTRLLQESWARLRQLPPSGQGAVREARLLGLAGADEAAAWRLGGCFSDGLLAARAFVEPILGGRLPPGTVAPGPRIDEINHLRGYWDDLREWGSLLQGDGLAAPLLAADQAVWRRHGGVPLGPKSNYEFGAWRNQVLMRRLRFASSHPARLRLLREFLEPDDSVETLIELGGFLETQGLTRECIEIYRRLPERAPANVEYCEQFLRVCENAWECGVAIPYIEKLFASDPQFRPLNLAENLLEEKHAKFLSRLQDMARLRLGAFRGAASVRAMPGRVPAEVPYLRELALLQERRGDGPAALAAWEELCQRWPKDEEGALHRARLLLQQGNRPRALEALRAADHANLWNETVRESLELRVQLAAEAGLDEELREVMKHVCGGSKLSPLPHTGAVIGVARQLARQNRREDALGLLLRAERSVREVHDRFRLRFEQVKLHAADPGWTPQREVGRISSLLRMKVHDGQTLSFVLEFLDAESRSPRARAWVDLLAAQPPGPLTSLALAAFALHLDEAQAARLTTGWNEPDTSLTAVQELTVSHLLLHRRPSWAQAVAVADPGRSLAARPVMVGVHAALGDRHAVDAIFARLVRQSHPGGGLTVEFAEALASAGRPELATELYDLALASLRRTGSTNPLQIMAHAQFLIRERRHEQAETLLLQEGHGLTEGLPGLLVSLYRGWNRLDRIPQELAKFHLPDGLHQEILFLASQPAAKP